MMGKLFRKNDGRVLEAEEAAVMKTQGLIEWIMDTRGISNKELAERLDVSQAAISQMLGLSPKNLSVKKLARVICALGDKLLITSEIREAYLSAQRNIGQFDSSQCARPSQRTLRQRQSSPWRPSWRDQSTKDLVGLFRQKTEGGIS